MRQGLLLISIVALLATSCTKNHITPVPSNSVTINGKAYSTVVIGNQTWTSQNYDGPGGLINPSGNENIYGKYYTVNEMNAIVLPKGWRVPTKADFENLIIAQGNYIIWQDSGLTIDSLSSAHLRSTKNWTLNGDNLTGFNAEPAGVYNSYNSQGFIYDAEASFWSSTPGGTDYHYEFWIYGSIVVPLGGTKSGGELDGYGQDQFYAMSLRFVKDNKPNLP